MIHRSAHEVELFRDDDCYRVFVDLPGFEPDELDVRWYQRRLEVSAEHSSAHPEASSVFHHEMGLPAAIRAEEITATYRDGVLEVELPIDDDSPTHGLKVPIRT